jgi:hypothetical protein
MYARFEMFGVVFSAWVNLQIKRPVVRNVAPAHAHAVSPAPAHGAAVQPELEYINF